MGKNGCSESVVAVRLSNGLFAGKGRMSECHGRPLVFPLVLTDLAFLAAGFFGAAFFARAFLAGLALALTLRFLAAFFFSNLSTALLSLSVCFERAFNASEARCAGDFSAPGTNRC